MRWTIRRKLYSMLAVIAALLAVLGGVTYERFGRTAEIEDELNRAHRMEVVAVDMERTLLEARRREKDFLLRDGDNQYKEIVEKEGQAFLKASAELRALSLRMGRDSSDQRELSLTEVDDGMKEYLSAFAKGVEAFHEHGLADTGAQGRMRKAAHELEGVVEELGRPEILVHLLQMRRSEKDFLLRGDTKYHDLAVSMAGKLDTALADLHADADYKRHARELLRQYTDELSTIVATSGRLAAAKAQMHAAHTAMEPILRELSLRGARTSAGLLVEVQSVREHALTTLFGAFAIVLLVGMGVVTWVSRQISQGVSVLIEGTDRVASGDLTKPVLIDSSDELGALADSFNRMMTESRDMNTKINEAANSLATIASELSATVSEQSAAVRQQAAAVSETVSTIEEMTRSASSVADSAQTVSSGATSSVETSARGEAALKQSVEGMLSIREQVQNIAATILELSDKTQRIGGIISTVNDFAEQSSLLALNASIEAARAGEHGKAFSVVATEVKKLAEQSQQATDKVRVILEEIQRATHSAVMVTEEGSKRVDRGVGFVETAGNLIVELVETIKGSARSAKQIAAAAQQQASGVEQVSTAMTGIDESARQNVAAIKQTEAASQTLADITQTLQKTTARYRLA
jgi:methyl-accepting chemotaxis protein